MEALPKSCVTDNDRIAMKEFQKLRENVEKMFLPESKAQKDEIYEKLLEEHVKGFDIVEIMGRWPRLYKEAYTHGESAVILLQKRGRKDRSIIKGAWDGDRRRF